MRFRASLFLLGIAVTGCDRPVVEWQESQEQVHADEVVPSGLPSSPPALPVDPNRCESSGRATSDNGREYAAWLSRRADSSVVVLASAYSDSTKTWSRPGIVDSVDVAHIGCDRPPPSIAAAGGYVHVSYSLDAPEGFGIFFAHSMDGTATFHSAIPVVYGDRLSRTAIAADGNDVVVAYEDPNGSGRRIDVAISLTQGHSFEPRVHGSPSEMLAERPEISLHDSRIDLSFGAPGRSRSVRVGQITQSR